VNLQSAEQASTRNGEDPPIITSLCHPDVSLYSHVNLMSIHMPSPLALLFYPQRHKQPLFLSLSLAFPPILDILTPLTIPIHRRSIHRIHQKPSLPIPQSISTFQSHIYIHTRTRLTRPEVRTTKTSSNSPPDQSVRVTSLPPLSSSLSPLSCSSQAIAKRRQCLRFS
jgi:hypothetical protein